MRRGRAAGFSLIEAVAALVVLGLLAALAAPLLGNGVRAYNDNAERVKTLAKLRLAGERLTREIREIRRNPLPPFYYDISAMGVGRLEFFKSDGTRVTLTDAAPLATLAYDNPPGIWTLSDGLGSLRFSYWQADGVTPASLATLAFVEFELVLSDGGYSYPQRCRVALRNQP